MQKLIEGVHRFQKEEFGRYRAPVMNKLFHTAPIDAESWLRIAAVAGAAFVAVEIEKRMRFGRRRGEHAIPE